MDVQFGLAEGLDGVDGGLHGRHRQVGDEPRPVAGGQDEEAGEECGQAEANAQRSEMKQDRG